MPSLSAIRLSWPEPESSKLLTGWIRRGHALKVPVDTTASAIRSALKHAAECRCAEHDAAKAAMDNLAAQAAKDLGPDKKAPPSNPLRSMREAAGLKQPEAARRMGITRGALSQSEQRATVSPAMIERARKAYAGGGR